MPNLSGLTNSKRDHIDREKNLAVLGGNLEFRQRVGPNGIHNNLSVVAAFASGVITTTRRTFGMPTSSSRKFGHFPPSATTLQIASTSNNVLPCFSPGTICPWT